MVRVAVGLDDGWDAFGLLRDNIGRLCKLRSVGLDLINACEIELLQAWHAEWAVVLHEIRMQLFQKAPQHAKLLLWPDVSGSESLEQMRIELVRAAVGCRELNLLMQQIIGPGSSRLENLGAPASAAYFHAGRQFVGPSQQFEGAIRLRGLIEAAQSSLAIVDQYIDSSTFALAAAAPDGIERQFLGSDHPAQRARVTEAWARWRESWGGNSECRIGAGLPHFRLLFVDGAAYHVDASLKDFGSSLTFFQMLLTEELSNIEGEIVSIWRQAIPV